MCDWPYCHPNYFEDVTFKNSHVPLSTRRCNFCWSIIRLHPRQLDVQRQLSYFRWWERQHQIFGVPFGLYIELSKNWCRHWRTLYIQFCGRHDYLVCVERQFSTHASKLCPVDFAYAPHEKPLHSERAMGRCWLVGLAHKCLSGWALPLPGPSTRPITFIV